MAIQIDPPKKLTKLEVDQAWFKLMKALNSQLTDTGWANILFVDGTDGNDDSAKRGSITFKYQTIQAALDAALASDVVWVGPGTYTEDITWPNVNNVTLQGVGPQSTFITNATAVNTVTVAPTVVTVLSAAIVDVAVVNSSALDCIAIYGGNDLQLGNDGRILLKDIIMTSSGTTALDVDTAANLEIVNVSSANNNWTFAQTGRVLANNIIVNDTTIDNDPAGDEPAAGFDAVIYNSAVCADVTVTNLGQFVGTDDVEIVDLSGDLVDTAGGDFGNINMSGRVTGDVAVTFDAITASVLFLILDYARISGSFTFGRTAAGTGTRPGLCRAKHATFFDTTDNSITADDYASVDLRMALFDQDSLQSLSTVSAVDGTFDRTNWVQAETAVTTTDYAVTWSNANGSVPYPTGGAPLFVGTEVTAKATGPVQVDAKTATGCTLQSTVQGNVVLNAYRSYLLS